ncbi:P-loop ATPase, Sll1717 family [Pseudomonas lutea]|uniref:ATPase n=1 Tax=Pseudomonas lutea TaxID=243924 RepID=A0A9X0ED95_9PSED|nr:hypothetical protein [Pseudomonas lutea]KGF63650.1 hypothetical protein LT42_17280 [Pseudomonas lutea]
MDRVSVLQNTVLGSRIAEDEVDELHAYFVETDQWQKLVSGKIDVVFGSKGSGKSALYSLLVAKRDELRLQGRTLFMAAENPRGTPVFRDLSAEGDLTEDGFRNLWKLYFLSLTADYVRHQMHTVGRKDASALEVIELLTAQGLLMPDISLLTRLRGVMEYLRKFMPEIEGSITDPSGMVYGGKITFGEPTIEQRGLGYRSLDNLLAQVNKYLSSQEITVWLALDRLDVAFADSDELEGMALKSLFRTYMDMMGLSHVKIKIFLRDDIWQKIVKGGFREASHLTRSMTLSWDSKSLLNLIVRRLVSNADICTLYNVKSEDVLASEDQQKAFFSTVFPPQVDIGKSKPQTLDWMLSRTADGTRRTAPRELIHLLLAARDEQLKQDELGSADQDQTFLISRHAIRAGLLSVSKARYEQTLCAENPSLQPYLQKLDRQKAQQSVATLARVWGCSEVRAAEVIERLVESGFFERRGTRDVPIYWVPMLYRGALNLVQGAA